MAEASYNYSRGESNIFITAPDLLDQRARDIPQKPAFIFRYPEEYESDSMEIARKVITFKELASKSLNLAGAFLNAGIKPGDKTLIIGSNCPEYIYVDYACLRLSALMMRIPLNFGTTEVLLKVLKKHKITTLILDDAILAQKIESSHSGLLLSPQNEYGVDLERVLLLRAPKYGEEQAWKSIDAMLQDVKNYEQVMEIQRKQDPDDIAFIFPTSGSTGDPKYVMHSHFTFVNGAIVTYGNNLDLNDPNAVYMLDRPFSWIGGAPFPSIIFGITVVICDPVLFVNLNVAKTFFQIANEERVTASLLMSFMIHDLKLALDKSNQTLPKTLNSVLTGGELIPLELLDFAKQLFGRISLGYGCTESTMSCVSTQEKLDGKDTKALLWMDIFPGYELKVTNKEGNILPKGSVGNISMRSRYTMIGYMDDEKLTKETKSPKGWLSIGDLGMMNTAGQIKIVGREKDVISRGGNKVYPILIENLLINHSKVSKVAVVGVPDHRLFNEICAFIIPLPGVKLMEAELREYVDCNTFKSESLATPKYYIFLDTFPKTSTGKVHKASLLNMAIAQLDIDKC